MEANEMIKMPFLSEKEKQAVNQFSSRVKMLLRENLLQFKLFGSKVRGDFAKDSDVDILLVIKEKNYALIDKIYDILLEIDIEYDSIISLAIFSESEMQKNRESGNLFFENIDHEGIAI